MRSGSESLSPLVPGTHRPQLADLGLTRHHPDASETFLPNLIHSVYTTQPQALLPHRLGLLFMVLAIGTMVDLRQGPDRIKAERYHSLARAALCEVPLMDDTSLDAVNALVSSSFGMPTSPARVRAHKLTCFAQFFMEWYLLTFSDNKKALEYAWGIMVSSLSYLLSLSLCS